MITIAYYVFPLVVFLYGLRKVRERSWGKCTNNELLTDKIVIVTGANTGIGYEIAKEMAVRRAHVVLACRNLERAAEAVRNIKQQIGRSSVLVPMLLDLGSIRSIKNFAEEINLTYPHVDVLINNAGVSYPSKMHACTSDGFEIHLGTNHLGHFLLTNLLLDALARAEDGSRVVTVASTLHEKGWLGSPEDDDTTFLALFRKTAGATYADSKLANVYFSRELARRVAESGSAINTYAVCPGWVYTNLFRNYKRQWYEYFAILPLVFLFMRSPKQGAETIVYCATQPELKEESGLIYKDCKRYKSKLDFDNAVSRRLWEVSVKAVMSVDQHLRFKYQH